MNTTLSTLNHSASWDVIKEAHQLCYEPDKIEDYYEKWSGSYNHDVFEEEYSAPEFMANYLASILQNHLEINPKDQNLEILDAGCGTGLVGNALCRQGFQNIDGFDLSHKMVEIARQTEAYRYLRGGCDMTSRIEFYQDDRYQATVCCGVFTTGYVHPIALEELIRITKAGGILLVSTRKSYYDVSDFQLVIDNFQEEGKFSLIDSVIDGPYIAEEGAHYWAFKIS